MNNKNLDALHASLNEEEQEELIQEHIKIRKLFNNIIYYYNSNLDNKNKNKNIMHIKY